jgi:hypothetical protein
MRKVHNKLSARVLYQILQGRDWNQGDLSSRTGIVRSMISEQLSGQRPIRDDHLVPYLSAFDRTERQVFLAAWLRDTLSSDVINDVLDVEGNRVQKQVAEWCPLLDPEQTKMLNWWSVELARDPELDAIFRAITRKAGYRA